MSLPVFFKDEEGVRAFLARLVLAVCPNCGASRTFGPHGFIYGFTSPESYGKRARRIRCRRDGGYRGCGKTFSLRRASSLPWRCFGTRDVWRFIRALQTARCIKKAWERTGLPLALQTGYRLYKRLRLCRPVLFSRFLSGAAPPEQKVGPLSQVYQHLRESVAHGSQCPVSTYQLEFQKYFLAFS